MTLRASLCVLIVSLCLSLAACTSGGFARSVPDAAPSSARAADEAYAQGVLGATLQQTVDAANKVRDTMEEAAREATKLSAEAIARGDAAQAQAHTQAASSAQEVVDTIDHYKNKYVRTKPQTTEEGGPTQIDAGATIGGAVSALLPPPWNALAMLGIGVWGVWERQRGRGAARAIVNSIDAGRSVAVGEQSPLRAAMQNPDVKKAIQAELARNSLAASIVRDERIN